MKAAGSPRAPGDHAAELGHEARASATDHAALRLWLRMLSCTTQVTTEIRRRLRRGFGVTLARFDYMAQLHRRPEGLKMSELSSRLMVTGGNVTGLTDELQRDGLVVRASHATDRRAWIVRLTPKGRRSFEAMARAHEEWILELLGGLDRARIAQLHGLLGELRGHLLQIERPEEK
ncbi:MAG: transcriptional regulator, MarR family [Burkholderiaceae bacterium]|nr:transcriptional regulator, MarR family [Burkholderiaceae bacterium]